jgi:hypothetical protein
MAVTRTWQDFAYYIKVGRSYKIMFYDRASGTIRTEDGYVSRKGRVGFEFEVIEDDFGITATNISYRDVRAAQEIIINF